MLDHLTDSHLALGVSKGHLSKQSAGSFCGSTQYLNIHQDSNIAAAQYKHNVYSGVAVLAPARPAFHEAVWGSWAFLPDLPDEKAGGVDPGVSRT